MSNHPQKPSSKIHSDQVSTYQQQIAEILNPHIDENRKKAISRSPIVIESQLVNFPNIPDYLMAEVIKADLVKEFNNVPRCRWQAPRNGDKITHFLSFIRRYGKVMPYSGKKEMAF